MPEPRVGFVVYEFPSETQTFVADAAEELLARGFALTVFVRGLPFSAEQPAVRHRVYERIGARRRTVDLGHEERWGRVEQIGRLLARAASAFARDPRATLRLARRALREPAPLRQRLARLLHALPFCGRGLALLHIHFTWSCWDREWLARLLDLPLVVTAYGADVSLVDRDGEARNAALLRAAQAVLCTSRHLETLLLRAGAPEDRVAVVRPRVDCERFAPGPAAPAWHPVVATVARLHWKKGHADGLRAIAALRKSGRAFRWRVIGAGPEEPALRAALADLDLGDHVELAGALDHDAVRDALQASAICFQPSVREELGVAAAKAQACGLQVVATRVGGVAEVVEDGVTGLLVAPRDDAAMAEALARLLDDPAAGRALGARGRERVQREFDGEAVRGALAAVYRRLLASPGPLAAAEA